MLVNPVSCATRSRNVNVVPVSVPGSQENAGRIVVSGLVIGAMALRWFDSPAEPAKSGRPQPKVESGLARFDESLRSVSRIAIGPNVGNNSFIRVMPAA